MDKRVALRELRDALANLYPSPQDIRRVVADAALDPARINLDGPSINIWHQVLNEASRVNRIDLLMKVALNDYGENPKLIAAYQAYRNAVHPASSKISRKSLADLRNVLATLYNNTADAQRIVADARINEENIDFSGKSVDVWQSILTEAQKQDEIDSLIEVVSGEYGQSRRLLEAYNSYRLGIDIDNLETNQRTIPENFRNSKWQVIGVFISVSAGVLTLLMSVVGRDILNFNVAIAVVVFLAGIALYLLLQLRSQG